jgi:hypothetical protein
VNSFLVGLQYDLYVILVQCQQSKGLTSKAYEEKMRKKRQPLSEYNELKTRITVSITPTAVNGIDAIADSLQVSRSELMEQIGRGLLKVVPGWGGDKEVYEIDCIRVAARIPC